jgi:NADPH-dependent F420 reductase
MQVALLGGTGSIGEGLALRFGRDTNHDLLIGSREAANGEASAAAYAETLADRGAECSVTGHANPEAAAAADVAVLAVPPYYVADTIESVAGELDSSTVLVSPAVGMDGDEDGLHYKPPQAGSVTELAAATAPDDVPVVGAFHNLSADRLADLDAELGLDTLVVGSGEPKRTVLDLAREVEGLCGVDAGPLANAPEIEGITPLLINVDRYNDDMHDTGVRFDG